MTPNNGSGHGRGQYASPVQVQTYLKNMEKYLRDRNAAWLDRNTDAHGNIREGVKELCNRWQADGHLVKWAIANGWLDPASMPEGGIKNRQIGLYSAVVYHRNEEGHRAIAFELRRYFDELEWRQSADLERKEASCR